MTPQQARLWRLFAVLCVTSVGVGAPGLLVAATVPDLRGTWGGSVGGTLTNCQDADSNGSGNATAVLTITNQPATAFAGTGVIEFVVDGEPVNFILSFPSGTISEAGAFSANFTFEARRKIDNLLGATGNGFFSGDVSGNRMTVSSFTAQATSLDTCILSGKGTITRSGPTPPPIVIPGSASVPYDLDGDGTADLVWRNTSSGVVAVWLMNGTTISSSGFLGAVPSEWQVAGIGDVDGDDMADVIWRNKNNGMVAVWLMNGLTRTAVGFPGSPSTDWEIEQVGDVDGNGAADLVWRNTKSGVVAVWLMNGTTIASSGFLGGVPAVWQIVGFGDVNGDRKADVLWRNNAGVVAVWVMDRFTITRVGFPGSAPLAFEVGGVGDVDGNGTTDVVWRNTGTGGVVVWLMNGTTIAAPGFLPGKSLEWEIGQVGDTDGDGKADIIWFNTSTGAVDIWRMNGGTITSTGSPGSTSSNWKIQGFRKSTIQAQPDVTLTVVTGGSGKGTVTSTPTGINCGAACSAGFATDTSLTLTATPASGSTFAGWSGGGCSGSSICSITITSDTTATAMFNSSPTKNPDQIADSDNGIALRVRPTAQTDVYAISWTVSNGTLSKGANEFELQLYVGGGQQWQGQVFTDEPTDEGIPIIAQLPSSFCLRMVATKDNTGPELGTGLSGNKFPCL